MKKDNHHEKHHDKHHHQNAQTTEQPAEAAPPVVQKPAVAHVPHLPHEMLNQAINNKDDHHGAEVVRNSKKHFMARSMRELTDLLIQANTSGLKLTGTELETVLKEKTAPRVQE